jgi:hypothetical protein
MTVYASTVNIILYVMRTAARMENYMSFMIAHAKGKHDTISGPLRDVEVTPAVLDVLEKGQAELRQLLHGPVHKMLESWCYQAMKACENKQDDKVVDENSRIACTLHAHLLLLYRNMHLDELDENVVSTLLCAFIFLATRHTWNMKLLLIPETELFELLQVVRRKLITWVRTNGQKALNEVMEGAVRVAAGTGIRLQHEKTESVSHFVRKWAFIEGQRSVGRFTVISSANQSTFQGKTSAFIFVFFPRFFRLFFCGIVPSLCVLTGWWARKLVT